MTPKRKSGWTRGGVEPIRYSAPQWVGRRCFIPVLLPDGMRTSIEISLFETPYERHTVPLDPPEEDA